MKSAKLKDLLTRYLKAENSVCENERVENWYQKLDDQEPVQMDEAKEEKVKMEIWLAIAPRLTATEPGIRKLNYLWLQIAASVLVLGTIGLFVWQKNNAAVFKSRNSSQADNSAYTLVRTNAGERRALQLPDGSSLLLNGGSTIRFQNDFSHKRNIEIIDGEVFFDVKHDAARPFIIKSGVLTTQVLGTAFNIKAYAKLNKITVAVIRGKVGVMAVGKPVEFLLKGRELSLDKRQNKVSLYPFNEQERSWQQGDLVLNDASFDDMAVLMNKNYGVHLETPLQSIKSKHFTVTINTSMPYLKALEVIAAIHHLKIKERRGTIQIYK
ncbi:FecR family protein [Dyadobacter sp. 3J3]|uniref:FecR family protein n=1 Tax=Dyadobacter sp. 3J3 TaxID=2606600 RepID=UPI00135B08FA|nr:FecR family protein [Dyadobacter sp. 3J3]